MSSMAYYNEFDPFAAAWLRELIAEGHIAFGVVDERSIEDVRPSDLAGFTQCHFFAGIGIWSYALRRAGWPDDRQVWTGSCPCQPFSSAGKGAGFADERHLWPAFHHLIRECRPDRVYGEQVASKDGLTWIDLVLADLEGTGYAAGAVDTCAAGFGAPHIRQRLYWVADAAGHGHDWTAVGRSVGAGEGEGRLLQLEGRSAAGRMENAELPAQPRLGQLSGETVREQEAGGLAGTGVVGGLCALGGDAGVLHGGESGGVADAEHDGHRGSEADATESCCDREGNGVLDRGAGELRDARPSPTNGHWRDADWLFCRDGKWRPVEPRPQPMANGVARSLGHVHNARVNKTQEEINEWAKRHQTDAGEAMHDLWLSLSEIALNLWPDGRLPKLHEAPFLLAFMRQLSEQRWAFSESISRASEKTKKAGMRSVRRDESAPRASCGRGLGKQFTGESANPVHILSSILARNAQEAWGEAYEAYAKIGFPLNASYVNRVAALRGYGNGIVAQAAQAFIEATL